MTNFKFVRFIGKPPRSLFLHPSQQTFVLMKTSFIFVCRRRLHQDEYVCLSLTSSRRLAQDQYICLGYMSSRRLQDVFKTSSRHLQDALKTSSRRLQNVFKTSSIRLQDVLVKTDIFVLAICL